MVDIALKINLVADGYYATLDEAKAALIEEDRVIENGLLAPTDWYVIRKAEKDIAIPEKVTAYRNIVRDAGNGRATKINACSSFDELLELLNKPQYTYGEDGLVSGSDDTALDIWLLNDLSNSVTILDL